MRATNRTSWVLAIGLVVTVLLASCGGGGGGDAPAGDGEVPIIRDDFDELDQQVWDIEGDGDWEVLPGGVLQLDTLQNTLLNMRLEEYQDGGWLETLTAVSARVRIDELEPSMNFELAVWEDAWVCFSEEGGSLVVELEVLGSWSGGQLVEQGRWYEITVELAGDTYNFFIDGQLVFTGDRSQWHDDAAFSLYADNALASIDYFEAYGTLDGVPVADFSGDPRSGEAPLTVQFTDESTGYVTEWLWDFGDGAMSMLENPSHTYTSEGEFTVSLTVEGPGGSDTETKAAYISVSAPGGGGDVILGVSDGEPSFEFPDEPGGQSYEVETSNIQYNTLGQVVSYDMLVTFSDTGHTYEIEVRDIVRNAFGDTVSYTATVNGEVCYYP